MAAAVIIIITIIITINHSVQFQKGDVNLRSCLMYRRQLLKMVYCIKYISLLVWPENLVWLIGSFACHASNCIVYYNRLHAQKADSIKKHVLRKGTHGHS